MGKYGKLFQCLLCAETFVITTSEHKWLPDLSLTAAARISPGKGLEIQSLCFITVMSELTNTQSQSKAVQEKYELGILPKEGGSLHPS